MIIVNFLQGAATGMLLSSSVILMAQASGAFAQDPPSNASETRAPAGNAFLFQGRMEEGGVPSSGSFDFEFQLFDAASGIVNPSATATIPDLQVTNGLFSVPLDFGTNAFQGQQRFIEVRVRPGASSGAYTTLPARQELTPAPYALFAANTWSLPGNAGTTPGTNFIGTVDNTALEFRVNDFVAGRLYPSLSGANVIMGHSANEILGGASYATIAGGGPNNEDFFSDVNRVSDNWGTVGGGTDNYSGNGGSDPNDAAFATIAGGESNFAKALRATIGGGASNRVEGESGTVAGGHFNNVYDHFSFIGGGDSNSAGTNNANPLDGNFAVVVGGELNQALDEYTFVGGGELNEARQYFSVIVGGTRNIADRDYIFIGGGDDNVGTGEHAVIGGGSDNTAHSYSTIGGGRNNSITASNGFIGGGINHAITASNSVIGGGGRAVPDDLFGNRVTDQFGTVGGGGGNMAGDNNADTASAMFGTVAGGRYNITNGFAATVPGGESNIAQGDYSLAAGRKAWTTSTADGSFAWADSQNAEFMAADANTFAVRASGGWVSTLASPSAELDVNGELTIRGTNHGPANEPRERTTSSLDFIRNDNGPSLLRLLLMVSNRRRTDSFGELVFSTRPSGGRLRSTLRLNDDGAVTPGFNSTSGATGQTLGLALLKWREVHAFNGVIQTSDARLKKNIENLGAGLDEVMRLRPVSFDWLDEGSGEPRMGLIAQEVQEVLPGISWTSRKKTAPTLEWITRSCSRWSFTPSRSSRRRFTSCAEGRCRR